MLERRYWIRTASVFSSLPFARGLISVEHSCEEFARRGCKVYATSRNLDTIGDFQDTGIRKLALDVTSDDAVQRVVQDIAESEGKIDVVVNNAGLLCPGMLRSANLIHCTYFDIFVYIGPLIDQSFEDLRRLFDTNTFAALRVAKAVIPLMAKWRSGVIVNIGSVVGEMLVVPSSAQMCHQSLICSATPWNGAYCASKAALQSISETLSMECKPFNISVLHVSSGGVKSNIAAKAGARFRLVDHTLYSAFLPNIFQRINASQSNSIPTKKFANEVVSKALQTYPPVYMTLGGHSWLFAFFKWLPKTWVLHILWRQYSKISD
jgi:1-acylglycerone phosphate reductase